MKMKRLLSWLLVIAMCFALAACQNPTSNTATSTSTEGMTNPTGADSTQGTTNPTDATTKPAEGTTTPPPEVDSATPLLYRVTDEDGHVVWLFGSIHVGREDYYPLPSYALEAFDGADSLAVEADIIAFEKDTTLQTQALTQLVYMDGSTIADHIPQELYTKSVEILQELNTYMQLLDVYCPMFWSSLIESLMIEQMGADVSLGVDRYLLERAYAAEKEILEVESAEFQYQMMAGFSDELQTLLLEASVEMYENPDMAQADLKDMMDLWASGDEQAFAAYLADTDGDMTPEEEKLYEEYNQAMIVERNQAMADYAEAALLSGKEVFVCVGSAHVVGDGAIAQLLSQRGYTVECITQ